MLAESLGLGDDVVKINNRLYFDGAGKYTVPDIYFPQSGNIIDYSYQLKTPFMKQIQNFHKASPSGEITIVAPSAIRPSYTIEF